MMKKNIMAPIYTTLSFFPSFSLLTNSTSSTQKKLNEPLTMDPLDASNATAVMVSHNGGSNPVSRGRTIAFWILLISLVSFAVLTLSTFAVRRRIAGRPKEITGGQNVEAAYPHNPNYIPLTGSRTLKVIKTTTGRITNAIKGRKMGTSATRTDPEDIGLLVPRSARLYNGPGVSARGAGVKPETPRRGQDAKKKRVDNIQRRRREEEMERQRSQSRMETNETAPPTKGFENPFDSYERPITIKEVWQPLNVEEDKQDRKGGANISAGTEKEHFV